MSARFQALLRTTAISAFSSPTRAPCVVSSLNTLTCVSSRRFLSTNAKEGSIAEAAEKATDSGKIDKDFFKRLAMGLDDTLSEEQLKTSDYGDRAGDILRTSADDEFADILDPKNPPILPLALLQRVDLNDIRDALPKKPLDPEVFKTSEEESWSDDEEYADKDDNWQNTYKSDNVIDSNTLMNDIDDPLAQFKPKRGKEWVGCKFCDKYHNKEGDDKIEFTNVRLLHQFQNARGMITNRKINRNCAKHQRKIAMAIKRARYMGLLGFTHDWVSDSSYKMPNIQTVDDMPKDMLERIVRFQKEYGQDLHITAETQALLRDGKNAEGGTQLSVDVDPEHEKVIEVLLNENAEKEASEEAMIQLEDKLSSTLLSLFILLLLHRFFVVCMISSFFSFLRFFFLAC